MPRTLRAYDVTNAAIDTLRADATLTTLCGAGATRAYTHIPEDVAPPYIAISAADAPWAEETNSDAGTDCEIVADVYSAKRSVKEVDEIANRVLVLLTTDSTYSGVTGYAGYHYTGSPHPSDVQMVESQIYRRRTVRVVIHVN